ncbi:antibiotic biosynthesis monooxygenase [Paenibacillus sp. NFR01]|uniref:antibiotic biosynthesis monooxygenase n=1 Tax=Paenibacillus sp. NFR01 TaxID=1566279 RepID=UPI0008CFE1BC|nr:antibiotic biosynthesis monooxygenase [Paenibacillus sp. NFR01]SET15052.1 heme oxygenase (staphylobilin-producing) [Paenibacillus sp. NFR01]
MLVMMRTFVVEKGYAGQIVERFSEPGKVDGREGLVDISVMVNTRTKEHDEVVVMIRWASEEAWKAWEKSPEHIQGHRENKGSKPDYILSMNVSMYEVKTSRPGPAALQSHL